MGINNALDISVSGITAERLHMELIASNIANMNTTKAINGGPYSRKTPVFYEKQISFENRLRSAEAILEGQSGGVDVEVVNDSNAQFQRVYNPGHPDADENGYVTLPNVSLSTEMTDLVYASKLYEANVTVFNATKKMAQETIQLQ